MKPQFQFSRPSLYVLIALSAANMSFLFGQYNLTSHRMGSATLASETVSGEATPEVSAALENGSVVSSDCDLSNAEKEFDKIDSSTSERTCNLSYRLQDGTEVTGAAKIQFKDDSETFTIVTEIPDGQTEAGATTAQTVKSPSYDSNKRYGDIGDLIKGQFAAQAAGKIKRASPPGVEDIAFCQRDLLGKPYNQDGQEKCLQEVMKKLSPEERKAYLARMKQSDDPKVAKLAAKLEKSSRSGGIELADLFEKVQKLLKGDSDRNSSQTPRDEMPGRNGRSGRGAGEMPGMGDDVGDSFLREGSSRGGRSSSRDTGGRSKATVGGGEAIPQMGAPRESYKGSIR